MLTYGSVVGMLSIVALVDEHPHDPLPTVSRGGLIVRTTCNGRSTEVDVLTDDGVFTITVPAVADEAAAERFAGLFRQVTSLRLEVVDHEVAATVRGIRHRLPVSQPVGLGVALSLTGRGVPAMVTRQGGA
jgi:hypothetical protein